jgi:predicted ABC-type ATPase
MTAPSRHAAAPDVIVLAGPNGAGKSTIGPALLRDALGITEFVNADTIAQGLSAFNSAAAAMAAGRIMFDRLRDLADGRASFAFETTLASRSLAPWLQELIESGYRFHLLFLWLPSAEVAVSRVTNRVRLGGHDVPEATIRRRYESGLRNFFDLYQPLAEMWQMYDNSRWMAPRLIAAGSRSTVEEVLAAPTWDRIRQEHDEQKRREK